MVLKRTGTVVRPVSTARRAVTAAPVKKAVKRVKEFGSNLDFSKYFRYVTSVLSNTTFVLIFALSAFLCYNYTTKGETSHIVKFVSNFVTQFPSFKDSQCSIIGFLQVFVPFIPAVVSVRPSNRFATLVGVALYYVFVPERTVYEYLVHGIIMYLIVRTEVKSYRLIGFAMLFLSYIMQFALPLPSGEGYNCTTPSD
uniref:ORF3 n=1 Tax=Bustos virus TaxID=1771907 RepID=A0A6G7AAY2_9VIRU|nr:ORF3 [Bustos virus]